MRDKSHVEEVTSSVVASFAFYIYFLFPINLYQKYSCEVYVNFPYLDYKNSLLDTFYSDICLISRRFPFLQTQNAAYLFL